jgi:hypothetical protein
MGRMRLFDRDQFFDGIERLFAALFPVTMDHHEGLLMLMLKTSIFMCATPDQRAIRASLARPAA